MKTRCKPDDRCIIVADDPGCECNIGALVTVSTLHTGQLNGRPVAIWKFRDASRPLKVLFTDLAGRVIPGDESWVLQSECAQHEGAYSGLYDHQLVPVHGDGEILLEDHRVEQPA
jgi:hypothetical protein